MTSKLEDLDFANDIALLSSTHSQMQKKKTNSISGLTKKGGFKINEKRTKDLEIE